jgi:hypothetical protein
MEDFNFTDTVFKESWSHYRHLEVMRKDYLNIFLTLNVGAVGIYSFSGITDDGRQALLACFSVISLILYMMSTKINQALTKQRKLFSAIAIARGFHEQIGPSYDSSASIFYGSRGQEYHSVISLIPYMIFSFAYLNISIYIYTVSNNISLIIFMMIGLVAISFFIMLFMWMREMIRKSASMRKQL